MNINTTEATLNEYGRFDELKKTIDKQKAKAYFEELTGEKLSPAKVNIRAVTLLRQFLLEGDFQLPARKTIWGQVLQMQHGRMSCR